MSDQLTPVPLQRIRFVARAWPRRYSDPERIEDFAALYREEGFAALPPPELIADGHGRWLIGDGVHRIEAARKLKLEAIPARLVGTAPDVDPVELAFLYALGRSAASAKPLTRAEKQAAVRRLLAALPAASDRGDRPAGRGRPQDGRGGSGGVTPQPRHGREGWGARPVAGNRFEKAV